MQLLLKGILSGYLQCLLYTGRISNSLRKENLCYFNSCVLPFIYRLYIKFFSCVHFYYTCITFQEKLMTHENRGMIYVCTWTCILLQNKISDAYITPNMEFLVRSCTYTYLSTWHHIWLDLICMRSLI